MPTVTVDGLHLRYRVFGPEDARPPLVFVHGAAGGLYVWQAQLETLKREHRLVLVDLPGHGASEAAPAPLDIPGHASTLEGLLAALAVPPAVVVGHSMGGAIALALALAAPERVRGLVLVATGARLPVSPLVFGALEGGLEAFGALLAQTAYAPGTPPEVVARFTGAPIQSSPEVVRADFEACQAFDLRERLGGIGAPALVLGGEADALVGAGRLRQLAGGLSRAELLVLPDAGHMVMQEAPDEVNAAIRRFVSALPPEA